MSRTEFNDAARQLKDVLARQSDESRLRSLESRSDAIKHAVHYLLGRTEKITLEDIQRELAASHIDFDESTQELTEAILAGYEQQGVIYSATNPDGNTQFWTAEPR